VSQVRIQYHSFALWRLLAALLVTAYHFCDAAPNGAQLQAWFEKMTPLLDMFFVLSGFLIYDRYHDRVTGGASYVSFLLRRLARLYPLHAVTMGFFVLVAIAASTGVLPTAGSSWQSRFDLAQLWHNVLLVEAWGVHDTLTFNYVSWSLSAEWFAYLVFPLLVFAGLRGGLWGLVLLLAGVVGGLELVSASNPTAGPWQEATTWAAWRVLADFLFGAVICVAAGRVSIRVPSLLPAWLLLGAAIVSMHAGLGFYASMGLIGLAVLGGALAERQRGPGRDGLMAPLMPIAAVSFGIYMWHPVVQMVMFDLLWIRIIAGSSEVGFFVWAGLAVVLTIGMALASLRWFEKPVGDWLARLWSRPSVSGARAA